MSILINKEELIENKISYYLLGAALFFLPYNILYSEILLIGFLPHTLIHARKHPWKQFDWDALWMASLYVLIALSTLYSIDKKEGIQLLGNQLPLLLFPVFLGITNLDLQKHKEDLLKIFSLSCTGLVLYLFAYHFSVLSKSNASLSTILNASYLNHNFSAPFKLHATYASIHVALSLCSCIPLLLKSTKTIYRFLYSGMILVLFAGLVMLSSRAVIISTGVLILGILPFMLLKNKSRWVFTSIAITSVLILFTGLFTNKDFKKRNIDSLKEDLSKTNIVDNQLETRMERWECAWQLIKESPIIGYGNGSEKNLLKKQYFQKKYYLSYIHELNAHNQYLNILITIGVIGFILFVGILFRGLFIAFRNKDFAFTSFLLLIIITSVSENILTTSKGIYFVGFFFPFFIYSNKDKTTEFPKF